MATIDLKQTVFNKKYQIALWDAVGNDDEGQPCDLSAYPDKTLQIDGTIGGATTVELQGSMDNSIWFTLTSDGTNAIGGAVGLFYVWENPRFIRPHTVGGTTTDLNFRLGSSILV